jgi:hypothetical protein
MSSTNISKAITNGTFATTYWFFKKTVKKDQTYLKFKLNT